MAEKLEMSLPYDLSPESQARHIAIMKMEEKFQQLAYERDATLKNAQIYTLPHLLDERSYFCGSYALQAVKNVENFFNLYDEYRSSEFSDFYENDSASRNREFWQKHNEKEFIRRKIDPSFELILPRPSDRLQRDHVSYIGDTIQELALETVENMKKAKEILAKEVIANKLIGPESTKILLDKVERKVIEHEKFIKENDHLLTSDHGIQFMDREEREKVPKRTLSTAEKKFFCTFYWLFEEFKKLQLAILPSFLSFEKSSNALSSYRLSASMLDDMLSFSFEYSVVLKLKMSEIEQFYPDVSVDAEDTFPLSPDVPFPSNKKRIEECLKTAKNQREVAAKLQEESHSFVLRMMSTLTEAKDTFMEEIIEHQRVHHDIGASELAQIIANVKKTDEDNQKYVHAKIHLVSEDDLKISDSNFLEYPANLKEKAKLEYNFFKEKIETAEKKSNEKFDLELLQPEMFEMKMREKPMFSITSFMILHFMVKEMATAQLGTLKKVIDAVIEKLDKHGLQFPALSLEMIKNFEEFHQNQSEPTMRNLEMLEKNEFYFLKCFEAAAKCEEVIATVTECLKEKIPQTSVDNLRGIFCKDTTKDAKENPANNKKPARKIIRPVRRLEYFMKTQVPSATQPMCDAPRRQTSQPSQTPSPVQPSISSSNSNAKTVSPNKTSNGSEPAFSKPDESLITNQNTCDNSETTQTKPMQMPELPKPESNVKPCGTFDAERLRKFFEHFFKSTDVASFPPINEDFFNTVFPVSARKKRTQISEPANDGNGNSKPAQSSKPTNASDRQVNQEKGQPSRSNKMPAVTILSFGAYNYTIVDGKLQGYVPNSTGRSDGTSGSGSQSGKQEVPTEPEPMSRHDRLKYLRELRSEQRFRQRVDDYLSGKSGEENPPFPFQ